MSNNSQAGSETEAPRRIPGILRAVHIEDDTDSSHNLLAPIRAAYERLHGTPTIEDENWDAIDSFINTFVYKRDLGLLFTFDQTQYSYRTHQELVPEEETELTGELAQAQYTVNLGDFGEFSTTFVELHNTINQHRKESFWLEHMDCTEIWKRATAYDLANPVQFMERIIVEIHDPLNYPQEWRPLGQVETTHGLETVYTRETAALTTQNEGPRTLLFSSTAQESSNIPLPNAIPSVNFGISGDTEVTVYSIQLPPVDHYSAGKIQSERASIKVLTEEINAATPGDEKIPEDGTPAVMFAALQRIRATLHKPASTHVMPLMNLLMGQDALNEAEVVIAERDANLARFNSLKGGSGLVSFVSFLAIMKGLGMETVRIPLDLPFADHFRQDDMDELHANLQDLWIRRISNLESLTGIEPQEVGEGAYISLDISNWNYSLTTVNRKSRQIEPLLKTFQEQAHS